MAIYMKLGDIKGEATEKNHKDWIDVSGADLNVTREISASTGAAVTSTDRKRATSQCGELSFTKTTDKSTPKIMLATLEGKSHAEAEIQFCNSVGGKEEAYFTIKMKNVMVTSIAFSGSATESTDNVSLSYSDVEWDVKSSDDAGKGKGTTLAKWKLFESDGS